MMDAPEANLDLPHVLVLGGGPAGVGGAYQLRRRDRARVTLVEQAPMVGGNSGSFCSPHNGQRLDFGSHRLHPACDPEILGDIERLLGDDLLDRPRHGRIRLRGKWIHFPLKPVDLFLRLDKGFAVGSTRDMLTRLLPGGANGDETFADVLRANLGPTICDDFYFPYARKIWGREPDELSAIQARRRVSAGSFGKLVRKVLGQVPGLKPPGAGRFFYPRHGFGQISEAYAAAATSVGADLRLRTRVTGLTYREPDQTWTATVEHEGATSTITADWIWSTIPVTILSRLVTPAPPPHVTEAASRIAYRAMVLVYLELPVDRFTEFDAHYFPGADIAITRLSEPKNYAAREEPSGQTTLCAELPCDADDEIWNQSDEELGQRVAVDLRTAGVPLPGRPSAVHVRRLRYAYPVYLNGYEGPFGELDRWADALPRLLTYGRQGLFAHDNTHHALFMAYRAADCLGPDGFDEARWREHRKVFETHVVED